MREIMETTLKEMGLTFETDGSSYVHTTRGRYAPLINVVVTPDEDMMGATIIAMLGDEVPTEKRALMFELLNLVHGQNLWNVRFHLDENGRCFSVGKVLLWGKPFNALQFGDIFFSLLVTADRLHPCLHAVVNENHNAIEAFERFFITRPDVDDEGDGDPTAPQA